MIPFTGSFVMPGGAVRLELLVGDQSSGTWLDDAEAEVGLAPPTTDGGTDGGTGPSPTTPGDSGGGVAGAYTGNGESQRLIPHNLGRAAHARQVIVHDVHKDSNGVERDFSAVRAIDVVDPAGSHETAMLPWYTASMRRERPGSFVIILITPEGFLVNPGEANRTGLNQLGGKYQYRMEFD